VCYLSKFEFDGEEYEKALRSHQYQNFHERGREQLQNSYNNFGAQLFMQGIFAQDEFELTVVHRSRDRVPNWEIELAKNSAVFSTYILNHPYFFQATKLIVNLC
jgi:hypothetical protein